MFLGFFEKILILLQWFYRNSVDSAWLELSAS